MTSDTSVDFPPIIGDARRDAVDRARRGWIDRLIDRSRRNNLLYFRDLKTGTLDLTDAPESAILALLAGEPAALSRLLPEGADPAQPDPTRPDPARTAAQLQAIRRKAAENLEERGLATLFLAVGMATWTPDDGGRPPEAPILLLPIKVETRGRDARAVVLQRDGDPQVNAVLLFELATAHGRHIDGDALLGLSNGRANGYGSTAANGPSEGNTYAGGQENGDGAMEALEMEAIFAALQQGAGGVPGFRIVPRIVLGNFSFQKMAMVKDLTERLEELAAHDVIAAIAGDMDAAVGLPSGGFEMDARAFDRVDPDDEFFILDSDHSQLEAIAAVMAGRHVVIFGPPGTGKSQTIANLVAGLAAEGRRVLFVAEKRAALEAVYKRLEGAGVGHLALDLHGADVRRRVVIERLRRAKDTVRRSAEVSATGLHRNYTSQRDRLNDHDGRMHQPRPPSGHSVFELQGALLRLPEDVRPLTRWRGADLDRLDPESAEAILSLLRDLAGFGDLVLGDSPSPWRGADLADGRTAQAAMDIARKAREGIWPAFRSLLEGVAAAAGLPDPATFAAAQALADLVDDAAATLERYRPDLFTVDLDAWAAALAPASAGLLPKAWAFCASGQFRRARKSALALRTAGSAPAAALHAEVLAAADILHRWRALRPNGQPTAAPAPPEARTALDGLAAALDALSPLLGRGDLRDHPLPDLGDLLEGLAADTVTPFRIPEMLALEKGIDARGGSAFRGEIARRRLAPETWEDHFRAAWLASCLDAVRAEDPSIGAFQGRTHDGIVAAFQDLDERRLRLAAARLRREHGERVTEVMDGHPDQAVVVSRELEKRSRHMPLRDLLARAPDVLTALCPCWMASPLSVSQLLAGDRRYFDVVVFDEASQVLPEDAVAALLRGSQVVVAGDEHQLPPTTFFADGADAGAEDGGEETLAIAGFDSLLKVVKPYFRHGMLRVHYRSRDESLIAFSNEHIYKPNGHEMLTFPGPGAGDAVSHVLVPSAPGADGEEDSSAEEVRRVVGLVLEHAEIHPDESLGVIAMGIKHANRVQAALDEALRDRPDLDAFFDPNRPDRFFVKNLERVQGDERDAIILTVGYAKDPSGRLRYHFGPLNAADGSGYRRLNVAITRARDRMTVVSSFGHQDMDPARCTAQGVRLLRLYLEYAAKGGTRPRGGEASDGALSPFEADVRDALRERGIPCFGPHGASGYRIDLVAAHPDQPDRLVLAIECDGARYHSQPIARMRDRLRPQRLSALGWRFHRVWSTDWFLRRDEEISRAVAAWEEAVASADRAATRDHDASGEADTDLIEEPEPEKIAGPEAPPLPARPPVSHRESIGDYPPREIDALVRWLDGTGCLTEEEIVRRMVRELGFSRRGPRIEEAVRASIARVRFGQ